MASDKQLYVDIEVNVPSPFRSSLHCNKCRDMLPTKEMFFGDPEKLDYNKMAAEADERARHELPTTIHHHKFMAKCNDECEVFPHA